MSSPLRQVVLLYAGMLVLLWGAAFLEKRLPPDTKGDIREVRNYRGRVGAERKSCRVAGRMSKPMIGWGCLSLGRCATATSNYPRS